MKKNSVKSIVAIGIGAALFFVLGRFVAIPSPVPNTNISIQYGLLAFMSVVFGPIEGLLIGFIGHALIDFSYGWGVWWSWVIASGVFGILMGLLGMILRIGRKDFGKADIIKFNVAQIISHIICWGIVAPALDIVIYAEPIEKLFAQGLVSAVANIVTTAIVGTMLLAAYLATKPKKGSLKEE
ncbi:MAG: ECF-type riboflavin transporter substrate-binding protein [Eubacteriales bacterium]|nr:ECF-type riboflavin transporter substrate-binding protein [Eubacteriales bacterium]